MLTPPVMLFSGWDPVTELQDEVSTRALKLLRFDLSSTVAAAEAK